MLKMKFYFVAFGLIVSLCSCTSSSFDSEISKEEISAARSVAGRVYVSEKKCDNSAKKKLRYCLGKVEFKDSRHVSLWSEELEFQALYERHGNDILADTDKIFTNAKKNSKKTIAKDEEKLKFKFSVSSKARRLRDSNELIYLLEEN